MNNFKLVKYKKKISFKRVVEKIDEGLNKQYKFAIIIPACGEFDNVGKTLNSLSENDSSYLRDTVIILVINNPVSESDLLYFNDNQLLLAKLRNRSYQNKYDLNQLNLMWIDASSVNNELPGKGGVGMARKLGMDSALKIINWHNDPLLISLDADTIVENNYLKTILEYFNSHKTITGATVEFNHQNADSEAEELAIREYEYLIRYFSEKLKKAGSPYAYKSIGSAIVCRAESYVKVGGMKLHRGGEDFYFMQALRKLGEIGEIVNTTVYPSARISSRVPFGTGPRIQQCLNGKKIQLYNPKIFDVLKDTLINIKTWIYSESVTDTSKILDMLLPEANAFFISLDFSKQWPKIFKNNSKNKDNLTNDDKERLLSAFHIWFDAFRTLKFIHYLERNYPEKYPKVDIDNK